MIKDLQIKSVIENLQTIEHLIDEISEEAQICSSVCENIIIATTEAVSNCIIHGNKKNPEKSVFLHIEYDVKKVIIEVSDEGEGFDISMIPNPTNLGNLEVPNGRGIFLMRMLANEFSYDLEKRKFILKFEQK